MRKRNIVLFAGAAVVLTGIIAASLVLMKGRHSEVKGSQEVTTERKEEALEVIVQLDSLKKIMVFLPGLLGTKMEEILEVIKK